MNSGPTALLRMRAQGLLRRALEDTARKGFSGVDAPGFRPA